MATTTILDNLVAVGCDPKKIPARVARAPSGQPAPVAGQSQSAAPVAPAEQSVAPVETVEAVYTPPIGEAANPQRLLPDQPTLQPSQPEQPQPAKSAVDQPPRPRQTSGQPAERPETVSIEGEPAVQMTDSMGKLSLRWETQEDLAGPQPEENQVGASVSKATIQEAEIRTQANTRCGFEPKQRDGARPPIHNEGD